MAEYIAAEALIEDGYEAFFPKINSMFNRAGHNDAPLFPSYLFFRCDPENQGWPSFRASHRISGWVTFCGEVPSIPDELIIELRQRVDELIGGDGLWKRFTPGDQVRVISKTMDCKGEILEESKSAQGKAKVLLKFMGRMINAQVPWEYLQPVDELLTPNSRPSRRTRGKGRWIEGFGHRVPVLV